MILCVENPEDSTKKTKAVRTNKEWSKVSAYNPKKSVAFLYVHNQQLEKEIKKTIPFPIYNIIKNKILSNKFNQGRKKKCIHYKQKHTKRKNK